MYNIYMYKERFSQILLLPPAQVKAILDVPVQNSEQAVAENLTVKRVHITSKRITRCKQNCPTLQTRKKLEAAFTNYRSFKN